MPAWSGSFVGRSVALVERNRSAPVKRNADSVSRAIEGFGSLQPLGVRSRRSRRRKRSETLVDEKGHVTTW